jgi:hypothetical protein
MLLISIAVGCASPAPPHPPSLKLPEVVKDLTAERVGAEVVLRWTTPEKTTDRLLIKGAMTAEICRITGGSTSPAPACSPVKRLPVKPGAAEAVDTLPASLVADPVVLLGYRVQIFNEKERSAGLSAPAFAAGGAAPPAMEGLRISPLRDGTMLEWKQTDSTALVELDRRLVRPDGVVAQAAPAKKAQKTASKPAPKGTASAASDSAPAAKPLQLSPPAPVEITLHTPKETADAGGTVDHTAREDETYRYTAQRIRMVSLEGHTLEVRGVASAPVTMTLRDIFPPHVPSGLEAVPGVVTASDRSIDLSWTANEDVDVVGYIVYRQDVTSAGVAAGTATRLNATPVAGPAYRDQTAVAGRRYAYRVSAVDAAGNESVRSAEVQETLREQ